MAQKTRADDEDLDILLSGIFAEEAWGDEDRQMRTFRDLLNDELDLPVDVFVIGEPVSLVAVEYKGNARRGIVGVCRREDGSEHVIGLPEIHVPDTTKNAGYFAAYRRWRGLDPYPDADTRRSARSRKHKATEADIDVSRPVDLVVLGVKERAARCRLLDSDRTISLRASGLWRIVPGQIVTVRPNKQWRYAGHPYLSGAIESARTEVSALGLVPLELSQFGTWDPGEEYWGEEGEPLEEWAKPIVVRGPRPMFEMEQVLPGTDPDDIDSDPICNANDLKDAGDTAGAEAILTKLVETDLRCLDAHAHLGNIQFKHSPNWALHHYEVGVRIGELSLRDNFDGVLAWGLIDNRPFLRCMMGYGLCLWRLERFEEAEQIFDRMLWMNPSDNQGVRGILPEVKARQPWTDDEAE